MTPMRRAAGPQATPRSLRAAARGALAHDASAFTAAALNVFLSDTAVLPGKTMACHWNALDPGFRALHRLTEAQNAELFAAMDVMVERVRASGVPTADGLARMLELATLDSRLGGADCLAAIIVLAEDHAAMALQAQDTAGEMEQGFGAASHHMLVARKTAREETAWLPRSHIPAESLPEEGSLT